MPYDKKKQQTYCAITVYFNSGTKVYKMAIKKKAPFLKAMKLRKDVIKFHSETYKVSIY